MCYTAKCQQAHFVPLGHIKLEVSNYQHSSTQLLYNDLVLCNISALNRGEMLIGGVKWTMWMEMTGSSTFSALLYLKLFDCSHGPRHGPRNKVSGPPCEWCFSAKRKRQLALPRLVMIPIPHSVQQEKWALRLEGGSLWTATSVPYSINQSPWWPQLLITVPSSFLFTPPCSFISS